MKKIFTILFLAFLIINSIGFIAFYYYNRTLLKKEMKEYFIQNPNLEKLELISIEKSQLNNSSLFKRINDKEIRFKGKLYDVFKEIVNEDRILFYGINDKKEEQFFEKYSKCYNEQFNTKDIFKEKIKNLNQLFFFGYLDKINSLYDTNIEKPKIIFLTILYKSIVLNIIVPPPKFN